MRHVKARSQTRVRGTRGVAWAGAVILTTAGLAVATESLASAAPPASSQAHASQHVAYLGHTFTVPSGWSVVNLSKDPTACVRFDVHAIYLGTPSTSQKCAAAGVAPAEAAVLVSPGSVTSSVSAQDNAIEQRITATLRNVQITASYGTDRSVVTQILASAGVPTPKVQTSSTVAPHAVIGITVAGMTSKDVGLGFDACAAPSTAQMTAWKASPYTTVGIYFGGADRTCAQPGLNASWVSTEAAANWHLLPLYAGPQVAPTNQLTSPASQGTASANDAVAQAQAIGLGQSSLLYYDMEGAAYTAADNTEVEAFLSAWTTRLHALGYQSAVYGEEAGSLAVLNADWGKMTEPDVIDVANPNGLQNDDPGSDPANHWTGHRVHQFVANATQTYGGVSIQIDEDDLNLAGTCIPTGSGRLARPDFVRNCGAGLE